METEKNIIIPEEMRRIGLIKFEILASGLRVSELAWRYMVNVKAPIRTRSGASGGLDLILPLDIHVNCPVIENFALESQLELDVEGDELVIKKDEQVLCSARTQLNPAYYGLTCIDRTPAVKIGQMCSGDRFCYGMTGPQCFFWRSGDHCRFCSIGFSGNDDALRKTTDQLLEVLEMAVNDPIMPAKHVLLGGGTPNMKDMGAVLAAELCTAIKKRFDLSCYVMISAPSKNEYIDLLWRAGVDELGMNLEFYSDDARQKYIPGKEKYISKKRYYYALEHAVSRFGPINTRSILVTGLENPEHTISGVESLASIGVMPILSPFRPLNNTELEHARGFDYKTYFDMYLEAHNRSMRHGIPIGPTCIPCQNNTLALPLPGGLYRCY